MSIVADLHLHSKYSRAVSPRMELPEIAAWASKKGIGLCATSDFFHPLWARSIKNELKETADGIFELKTRPMDQDHKVRFMLSVEIANIFSQGGSLRRVHNLLLVPSLASMDAITKRLLDRGAKLASDGRPILGMSSHDFLEVALSVDENIVFIPAHAWTPWFGQYGSKSGFDSIRECFGDLEKYIYGIETGLSSDPIMNWQIKELENRSILSFSDAHSAPKMGREATVFVPKTKLKDEKGEMKYSYHDISSAIKQDGKGALEIGFTIEFFPEEGKYHWTGHRACGVKYSAADTVKKGTTCPVCHRPLTVGVENRVLDLSKKLYGADDITIKKSKVGTSFVYDKHHKRPPFVSAIPLLEILGELSGGSPTKSQREYERLTTECGTEFDILLKKPLDDLEKAGGAALSKAIGLVRARKARIDPGYDGVFGVISVTNNDEKNEKAEKQPTQDQPKLF